MLGERKQRVVLTPKMYQSINYMISKDKKTKEIVEFHKDEFDLSKSSVLKIMREIFDCDDFDGLLEKVENRASGRELKENKMVLKRRELIKESLNQDGSNTLKRLQNLLESNGIYVSQTTIKTDIEKMNFRRKRLKNGNLIWVPNDSETIDIEFDDDDDIVEEIEGDNIPSVNGFHEDHNYHHQQHQIQHQRQQQEGNSPDPRIDKEALYFRRITFSLPKTTQYLFSILKKAVDQMDIVSLIMVMTKREILAHKTFSGPLTPEIFNAFLSESLAPKLTSQGLPSPRIMYMDSFDTFVDSNTGPVCRQNQLQIRTINSNSTEFDALERVDLYIHSKYTQIEEKCIDKVVKFLDDLVTNEINTGFQAYQ